MTSTLKDLLKKALAAIDKVHADTSGEAIGNLDAMREIAGHAETCVEALEADVQRAEGG